MDAPASRGRRPADRRALVAVLAVAALLAVPALHGAWRLLGGGAEGGVRLAARGEWGPGADEPAAVAPADAEPARPPAALRAWLDTQGSLRGAELDGDWGLDAAGALRPGAGLRRRFDHLLTLQGEARLAELRGLVDEGVREAAARAGLAAADAGARAAQVLDLWDRYVALLAHPWRQHPRVDDPASLAAALAERQPLRRERLGVAWADAFYGEEERALLALLRDMEGGAPPASAGAGPDAGGLIDRARLDPEARARLDAELQAQADWDRRVAAARGERDRLAAQPGLSAPQREAAWQLWLSTHADAQERLRIEALLAGAD